jgi:CubicO group peptidase (beta-lactamase class C family)/predicted AlkP superfamily pyrophosphatase or phosphodiesterase
MRLLSLIFLVNSIATAQTPGKIAAAMQEMIRAKEIPGAVTLVATREGVTHLQAIGQAGHSPASKPLRNDSIFWIASMTKPITGTAIMMLQEEGKLSVDDPVSKFIPGFGSLTLKHLMTHTSGLPEATNEEAKGARTLAELIPFHLNKPVRFEPGSKWQYCQSGLNTLGRIVEIASGQRFEKFLEARLFKPLGMKDTTFYLRPAQLARLVTPVKREEDGTFTEASISLLQGKSPTETDRYPAANGGLFSTAPDYARFARMILNQGTLDGRRYLKPESVKQMTTIQTGELVTGFTPGNGWGLTWCVVRQPQGITAMLAPGTFGHGGAYGTQAWIDPVNGVALILMVQRSNFANSDASPVRLAFQQAAMPPPPRGKVILISLDGFPAYALDDPKLPIPTLRKLMRDGVGAPMTAINPTVTWPNHTTMVTGVRADEHGLLANGTIVRTGAWPPVKVDPMIDKDKMVHVPTVYDAAHQAGLTTAQVDWVAINNAPGITWAFREWADADGPLEREMIAKGAITAADVDAFTKSNILHRDQIWTRAGVYLIKEHQPDLLLLHLLSLDSEHHQYGPNTLAGRTAMAFLDSCVEKLVTAVREAGLEGRTTFLIVSDHGFKAYKSQIRPAAALAAAGLGDKVYVLPEGGTAYVYASDPELIPRVRQILQGVEGIDKVIGVDEYAALGLPRPERDPQFGQLLLAAKDGYSFSGATGGPVTAAVPQAGGSHGYLASESDMNPIFIASGRGVRAGGKLTQVSNLELAPTIAQLLGVSLPTAKAKPIPLQ